MECNREQAERCIQIAVQAFNEFKTQRAENYLKRAEQLYPTQEAKELLEKVREFDNEQCVKRILSCKTHYKVLEISKNATEQDIVAAFKKFALLVHPDKNRAPRTNEAFLKVKEAQRILTDSERRRSYDLEIYDETDYESDTNDDNSFENDEKQSKHYYSFVKGTKWWETETGRYILVLLPVILLILIPAILWCLKLLLIPSPIFSLTPNKHYIIRKRTMAAKLPYYVGRDFFTDLKYYYQGSLGKLEKDVKNEYLRKLTNACNREKSLKEDYLEAALYSFNIQLLERAKSLTTPSCDELNLLNETLNRSNSYFPTIFTDVLKLLHSYVNRC